MDSVYVAQELGEAQVLPEAARRGVLFTGWHVDGRAVSMGGDKQPELQAPGEGCGCGQGEAGDTTHLGILG